MIFSFFLLLVSICITGSAGHTKTERSILRSVFVCTLLVIAVVRALVLGRRTLGTGILAALGAAVFRIVRIVCIVGVCRVGRIICVVRTHNL